jgi:hypothetical protein
MLIAEITPAAKKVVGNDPFNLTTQDLSFMSVIARPYVAGASKVNFQVNYGEMVTNGENKSFIQGNSSRVELTSEELSNWGTDDSVLFSIIASKLNLTIVRTHEVNDSMF